MGVMEKMRSSTKYIFWILIVSFGLLWGLADTKVFSTIMRGPHNLGSVNGKTITIEEYNNLINNYIENYQRQTGKAATDELRAYYNDMAWNELVLNRILQDKMKKLGITVTNEELIDMVTGKNPDPLILQQFHKKDGSLDRVALQAAINAPENTKAWIAIEHELREKRRRQKLTEYVQSALVVSDAAVQQEYIKENSTANFAYVRFPYSEIPDSTIKVSNAEMHTYYDNHPELFQQKESWNFRYVQWKKIPTKKDTVNTIAEVNKLRPQFAQAKNDSLFLQDNESATPYTNVYLKKSEVRNEFQGVFKLKNGEVSNVIKIGGRVHILKKIAEKRVKGQLEVKFIDFGKDIKPDPVNTLDKLASQADDFSYYSQDGSFEKEATRDHKQILSATASKGNPFIPGIGQSLKLMDKLRQMGKGDISNTIELPDRFLVVQMVKVTPAGVRPFDEVQGQITSVLRTEKRKDMMKKKIAADLNQDPTLAGLAKANNKKVFEAQDVHYASDVVPEAGREPAVVGAAFNLPEGKVSLPIEGESAIYVIKVEKQKMADASKIPPADYKQITQKLSQGKSSAYGSVWINELKKEAEIVDNRAILKQ